MEGGHETPLQPGGGGEGGEISVGPDHFKRGSGRAEHVVLRRRQRALQIAGPAPGLDGGQVGEVAQRAGHLVIGTLGVKVTTARGWVATLRSVPVKPNPAHGSVGRAGGQELVFHLVLVRIELDGGERDGGRDDDDDDQELVPHLVEVRIEWIIGKAVFVKNPVAELGPLLDEQLCRAPSRRDSSVPVREE